MSLLIRMADPGRDYPRLPDLLNLVEREPITEALLHEQDGHNPPGRIRRRAVAERDGQLIGYSVTQNQPWRPGGWFYLWLMVHPDWRSQDIGGQLFADALAFARQQGAEHFVTEVRDDDIISRHIAERNGFRVERHLFESILDLGTFDPERFTDVVAGVEAQGIRILSLADVGNTEDWQRKLYAVNYRGVLDDPASASSTWISYEELRANWEASSWFRPEGQIMAVLADDTVVGITAVGINAEAGTAQQLITAVDAPYRGRRIAQALKVVAARWAQAYGVRTLSTRNDSTNGPMLAINRKLGFVPGPGIWRMAW